MSSEATMADMVAAIEPNFLDAFSITSTELHDYFREAFFRYLPLLIAALIRPECMGGGDIKLTAAAGFVLGFWRGIWGMALGLLLAVLYFCAAMLFQKFIHHPLPAMTRAALPLGPFLSIGFAALYCFGG